MTMETPWIDGESQRHLPRSQKVGRHVPHLFLGVPVDGCLEPITLLLEEVGPAPSSRTQKVAQLPASFQCTPWIIALVVEPHVAAFSRHCVVDTRGVMHKIGRDKSLAGRAAGLGHRRLMVALVNRAVTGRTGRIRIVVRADSGSNRDETCPWQH